MALRSVPIHRVANRDSLFMGGDRELVMLAGLLAAALIFTAQDLRATVFGIALWFGGLFAFRLMAKSDPKMRDVYLRHRKYEKVCPPRSTPFRDNPTSQENRYRAANKGK